ncbi:MAG: S1 RNA-binding domain-containing protein [Chloroflexi bacterium]|nr:S1 RNA-binding domain-containing protein [Chloroflexota bacterium]
MHQSDATNGQQTPQQDDQEAENNDETLSMELFLEQGDYVLDPPKKNEIRKGVVASVTGNEVLVSIGAKSEGVISSRELDNLSEEERAKIQVGEKISVFILNPEGPQGGVILSLERALEEDDWTRAEELLASREPFEGHVSGFNKGGIIVNLGRLRAFVPASQVSMSRRMSYQGDTPEQKWGEMNGELIVTRIIEVDRQRRRLILSEKAASQESRESLKERLLEELEDGEIRKGRVTSLADFGAFVNINGADGLVHLSEISWDRIDNPKEVLEVGQEVVVKVISVDKERKRIGLSLRQLQDDPWLDRIAEYQVGRLVEGTVTRLTKFGAFARISDDLEGLIHVSELSEKRIEHPKEIVSEDEQLTLRIIKIDEKRRRIGLSLRKVTSGAYSDMDWEMTLAEIDELAEQDHDGDEGDPRLLEKMSATSVSSDSIEEETPSEEQPSDTVSDSSAVDSTDEHKDGAVEDELTGEVESETEVSQSTEEEPAEKNVNNLEEEPASEDLESSEEESTGQPEVYAAKEDSTAQAETEVSQSAEEEPRQENPGNGEEESAAED